MLSNIWRCASALTLFILFPAYSQDGPVACQVLSKAGLDWDGGNWVVSRYKDDDKFILVLKNGTLAEESVGKAIQGIFIQCRGEKGQAISCSDRAGGFLIFDPRTMQGTIAQTFGGISNALKRDSLTVGPFACQKF